MKDSIISAMPTKAGISDPAASHLRRGAPNLEEAA